MKGITIFQCSHVSRTVYLYRRGPWTSQIGHRAMSNTDGSWDLAGQTIGTNPYSTSVHRKVGLTTVMGSYGTKIVITCAHRSRTPMLRVIANFRRHVGCCRRRDLPHCSLPPFQDAFGPSTTPSLHTSYWTFTRACCSMPFAR